MTKKIYIQLFLIFVLVIISLFIFLKYLKKTNLKNDFKINMEQSISSGESLIEDLKYLSTDKDGNEYKIEAKKGNIDKDNPDIIYMEDVEAVILLKNSDTILINQDFKVQYKILILYLIIQFL